MHFFLNHPARFFFTGTEADEIEDEQGNDAASVESGPEGESRGMAGGSVTAQDAQRELASVFKTEPVDFVAEPVSRLNESLVQCMRLEIDFSDESEATVYFHEGTELLNDLRNQLATLSELKDLSPKDDLATADIGESEIMLLQTRKGYPGSIPVAVFLGTATQTVYR